MQIVTFIGEGISGHSNTPRLGALLGKEFIFDFQRALLRTTGITRAEETTATNHLSWFDLDKGPLADASDAYKSLAEAHKSTEATLERGILIRRSQTRLLAPIPRPGKLICIGLNYRDHAAESNMKIPERPVVFSKFNTSVIGPNAPVVLPANSHQVDYEAELAVVIGRRARNVKVDRAIDYVLGYTIVNDVSARDFQFADGQWQRGKSCDTFAPMGPSIVTKDEIQDPQKLSIKLHLNGKTMQDSNTDQLIFGVAELIEFLSETITLEPGDVIATGTPAGVGFARKPPVFLQPGDVMEVDIEKLGVLRSPVIAGGDSTVRFARTS